MLPSDKAIDVEVPDIPVGFLEELITCVNKVKPLIDSIREINDRYAQELTEPEFKDAWE